MPDILKIAEAVAEELAEYSAEVSFVPEYELAELAEMRVVVVPLAIEFKTLSRSSREELLKVSVGILKRGKESELPDLLKLSNDIGVRFLHCKLAGATCVSVAYDPIYSPEYLRQRNQFISVIQLAFKQIK
jgi:hypothetical protein